MKKFAVLSVLLLLISCAKEYDGETRLIFTSKVIDSGGNPVPNQLVTIEVTDVDDLDRISEGTTNQAGEITFIFPAPHEETDKMYISISGSGFHDKLYANVTKADFVGYKLNLGDVTSFRLSEVVELRIDSNLATPNTSVTEVSIEGETVENVVDYDPITDDFLSFPIMYHVLLDQTVVLHYTIRDNSTGISTQNAVDIPVANQDITYVINN
ncbi:MAG TPA: hypothetical protein VF581_13415 [Flavobacterium sp.]|jgi:hypothetical protein